MIIADAAAQAAFTDQTGLALAEVLASPVGPCWAHIAHFTGHTVDALVAAAEAGEGPTLAAWAEQLRAASAAPVSAESGEAEA